MSRSRRTVASPSGRTAGRVAIVSTAFVLVVGASGALSVAYADGSTPAPATSGSPGTGATEDGNAYVLSTDGTGAFTLALSVPGTSIAIDYTVDSSGAITTASTSTSGASVTADGHDLMVTLADGRTVQVEIGDRGDTVDEIETAGPDSSERPDPTETPDASNQGDDNQRDSNNQGGQTSSPEHATAPKPTDPSDSSDGSDSQDSPDSGSSGTGSSDSSDDGSGSGSD